jgi:hypothetical protein
MAPESSGARSPGLPDPSSEASASGALCLLSLRTTSERLARLRPHSCNSRIGALTGAAARRWSSSKQASRAPERRRALSSGASTRSAATLATAHPREADVASRVWRDARRTSSMGSDLHSCLGVYGSQRGRRDSPCPKAAASRAGEGDRRSAVGPADPRVQPEHRQGLMTISMPDRFRLAAPRGRRRRIGMAIGVLEQSRLASCPRPGRTKSTPLTRRRIAVWRLEWPPRVARARRDGRDGSCAGGRPRDVGHRSERWRALERKRGAAFEPPLASQVLLGIKQLEPNGQVLLRRPDCVRGHSGPPGVGGFAIRVLRRRRGRRRVSACCAVAGATLSRRARRHSC